MPKVSAAHKEQVRQRLLDATRRVVFRDGHNAATTRAILDEAGVSVGTLYNYFASKEELFEAVAEDVVTANVALFSAAGSPDEAPTGMLLRLATGLLSEPDDSPALAYFRGRLTSDPDVRAAIQRFNRYIVDSLAPLLAGAAARGEVTAGVDAEAVIELFDIVVDGLNRRHLTETFATDFDRVGSTAIRLLLGGIIDQGSSTET